MASEVLILRWCDVCAEGEQKVEAEQLSVHAGGFKVDLCIEHRAPFDEVTALIDKYGYRETAAGVVSAAPRKSNDDESRPGRKTQTKLTDPNAKVCPECLEPFSGTNGLSTLRNHMKNIHRVASSAYSAEGLQAATEEARRKALARQRAS